MAVIAGGRNHRLQSHMMVFESEPGPAVDSLPRDIEHDADVKIIFTGPYTKEQELALKKRYAVNYGRLQNLIRFLRDHQNPFYRRVNEPDNLSVHLDERGYADGDYPPGLVVRARALQRHEDGDDDQEVHIGQDPEEGDATVPSPAVVDHGCEADMQMVNNASEFLDSDVNPHRLDVQMMEVEEDAAEERQGAAAIHQYDKVCCFSAGSDHIWS
jgi:hypothetical protein